MKLEEIIKKHLNKVVKENESTENYMFFSNIQQIHRQCEMLMKMNPQELDQIIKNGHDWADDHVSEAKNNMDQVFDFFMNETKNKDNQNVTADMDQFSLNEDGKMESGEKDPCWKGYEMVGKKKKNGKEVPNCVPKKKK
jgi:dsDNA-specific endonuclease/ATPase MutS2